jgi:hypothetical protein
LERDADQIGNRVERLPGERRFAFGFGIAFDIGFGRRVVQISRRIEVGRQWRQLLQICKVAVQ